MDESGPRGSTRRSRREGERSEAPARRMGPSTLAVHGGEPRPKPDGNEDSKTNGV